jgi:hypothetical protein
MGAAHKVWQDAKDTVKVSGWESKLKLQDNFGPKLDDLEKLDREFEAKVKALRSEIEEVSSVATSLEAYSKQVKNALESSDATFLPRDQREHLLLARRLASKEAFDLAMHHTREPIVELLAVLKDLLGESWYG